MLALNIVPSHQTCRVCVSPRVTPPRLGLERVVVEEQFRLLHATTRSWAVSAPPLESETMRTKAAMSPVASGDEPELPVPLL